MTGGTVTSPEEPERSLARAASAPRAIGAWMAADHDRLDELWDRAIALRATDRPGSIRAVQEFAEGLREHIQVEEELLFPHFERGSDASARRLTDFMREEHRQIVDALATLSSRVDAGAGDVEDAEALLRNLLWAHNALEEGKLYPWFDERVDRPEDRPIFIEIRTRLPAPARRAGASQGTGA